MTQIPDAMPLAARRGFAIDAAVDERLSFIRRTYVHLFLELCGVALVASLGLSNATVREAAVALWNSPLLYFGVLIAIAFGTRAMLQGNRSKAVQYTGAGIWVVFMGLLIAPLGLIAQQYFGSFAILAKAATITGCVFTGLTAYAFYSRKDFSFLHGFLWIGLFAAIGLGLASWIFGFGTSGGALWQVLYFGLAVLMGGFVLYDTSKLIHKRHVNDHVAASVDLLVDFVLLFFYIAMMLMGGRR